MRCLRRRSTGEAFDSDDPIPALVVQARVAGLGSTERVDAVGKLDTGADISGVPADLLHELGVPPYGEIRIRAAQDAVARSVPTYFVEISLQGAGPFAVKVVAIPKEYLLVGRDLLNRCILHADGPNLEFELIVPGSRGVIG